MFGLRRLSLSPPASPRTRTVVAFTGTGTDATTAEEKAADIADAHEYTDALKESQRANLSKALGDCKYSDVVFVVGDTKHKFYVSRFLLSAISDVFNRMLYGAMAEAQLKQVSAKSQSESSTKDDCAAATDSLDDDVTADDSNEAQLPEVIIPDVSKDAFQCVVNYAYCIDPCITPQSLVPTRYACEKYNIEGLKSACDEFLESVLGADNVCILLDHIFRYKVECYEQKIKDSLRMFSVDIEPVIASKAFKTMCVPAMRFFLASNYVNISEDNIWSHLKLWADCQAEVLAKEGVTSIPAPVYIEKKKKKKKRPKSKTITTSATKASAGGSETSVAATMSASTSTTSAEDSSAAPTTSTCPSETTKAAAAVPPLDADAVPAVGDSDASADSSKSKETVASEKDTTTKAAAETVVDTTSVESSGTVIADKLPPVAVTRRQLLRHVYREVRFGQMTPAFFVREVVSEGVLTQSETKAVLIHLQCREYPCTPFKLAKRKADLSAKKIVLHRGTVNPPGWNYGGPKDALCFQFDKNVMLEAVGMLPGTGRTEATIKVYLGDNHRDAAQCGPVLAEMQWEHEQTEANTEPVPAKFKKRVSLKKDTKYTIEIQQRNVNSSQSAYVVRGEREKEAEGVKVQISAAAHSPNSTGPGAGALPTIWFYKRG